MKKYITGLTILTMLVSTSSLASVSSVSGADVKKGEGKIVARTAFAEDNNKSEDNRLYTRYGIAYGITESIGIELVANQLNKPNDSYEHENTSFRLNYQYLENEDAGVDAAVRFSYDLDDNDKGADEIEIRFMNSYKTEEGYKLTSNAIFENEVGPKAISGLQFEARWQATKEFDIGLDKPIQAGIEMFNDFKNLRNVDDEWDQDHEIGPVIKGNITEDLTYQTGILFGMGDDSPRASYRLFIYKKF